jgi:hypothetical protein
MKKLMTVLFITLTFFIVTISTSWAGKPIQPITEGGYATFDDSMAIQSDGVGVYADCSKEGGWDYVKVTYMPPDYSYLKINMMLGKMQNYPDTSKISNRFINFCFDVLGNKIESSYIDNKAVYDILKQYYNPTTNKKEDRSSTPGFINDNSVRAQFFTSNVSGSISGVINFLVDPSLDADCTSPKAINNEKINAFYDGSTDPSNLSYTDTATYGEGGQTFYRLDFPNGFQVAPIGVRTWVVTPNSGDVTLSVLKYRNKKGVVDTVYLANYASFTGFPIRFKLTVSLDDPLRAPRKYETMTTTWGDIKR